MKPTMEIRGVSGVKQVLSDIGPKHSKNLLRSTVHGVAGELRDNIRATAPSDGAPALLRTTFKTKRRRGTPTMIRSDVVAGYMPRRRGGKGVGPVWRWLEFGTTKIEPRGWILRAAMALMPRVPEIFMRQFGQKLESAVNRALKRQRK